MRTSILLATTTLVAVATLTGCGSDDSSDGGSKGGSALLSKSELSDALVTLDDLGDGFKVEKDDDDDDDDDTNLGCLNGLDELGDDDSIEPERDEESSFEADSDLGLPGVYSTVGTFKSTKDAAEVLTKFSDTVEDCKAIDETDGDGFRIRLDVSSDQDKTDDGATGQVNLNATGTASGDGFEFPFSVRFTAIQIGNDVALVGYVNAVTDLEDADDLVQRAYDRLAPIVDGKSAPDLTPLDLDIPDARDLVGAAAGA
ncbi:hypothetical protein ABIE44_002896 [Marmoricola sp. OAE513]|uniref:hypothetical protein n=1 Tax=Marmoricola sp. OAE513 TaxID=2817894 RepID=UPI001AE46D84